MKYYYLNEEKIFNRMVPYFNENLDILRWCGSMINSMNGKLYDLYYANTDDEKERICWNNILKILRGIYVYYDIIEDELTSEIKEIYHEEVFRHEELKNCRWHPFTGINNDDIPEVPFKK